jgi:hypothetical protein
METLAATTISERFTQAEIDAFASEPKITLYEAVKLADSSFGSLFRWTAGGGLRGVPCQYLRRGRRIWTSQGALERFFAKLTALDQIPSERPKLMIPKARRETTRARAINKAKATLQAAGI